GYDAFNRCLSLTEVKLPGSITTIDYGAFSVCQALTSVTIENSENNLSIKRNAFYACPLTNVIIERNEENVTLEDNAFPEDVTITYR
ncbi:MAG: leucine-rich repeat protein, partial [Clostridia bacterium]|nr:leucine-rich repeat protein [Clostridia bacterium]